MTAPAHLLPAGFRELLQSDRVTPRTRAALQERMTHETVSSPQSFSAEQFKTLTAICDRLIPQPKTDVPVDLPGLLDVRLQEGSGRGWRYDVLPPDAKLFPEGMDRTGLVAQGLCGCPFHELKGVQQDGVLRHIQSGDVPDSVWPRVPAQRFFEELLAVLAEIYYSHPAAKADIGDLSFADLPAPDAAGPDEPAGLPVKQSLNQR